MQIANQTPFATGWTTGFLPDGREIVTVVVKGTFSLRECGRRADVQSSLLEADIYGPDPARNAPVLENDFALTKPECDVLVRATAYAPDGIPTARVDVGVAVATMQKVFAVVGRREWHKTMLGVAASRAEPFTEHRLSYDFAFGGTRIGATCPEEDYIFEENPAGIGYCKRAADALGMELPRTEEAQRPVTDPGGRYRPMALGPLGRHWSQRARFAGTYDDQWCEEKLPFLPDDFNPLYFQAAPSDQRIPFPAGGERIVLLNLSREGRLFTSVPAEGVMVAFIARTGALLEVPASCDTLIIEPEENRLIMVWRATLPLERDPFEVREMVVVRKAEYSNGRMRARAMRRPYYDNLAELAASRRGGRL